MQPPYMDLSFSSKTFYFEHECNENEVVVLKEQVTMVFVNVEHLEKEIKLFQLSQKEGMFIFFIVFCNKTLEYFHVLEWKLDCQKKGKWLHSKEANDLTNKQQGMNFFNGKIKVGPKVLKLMTSLK
jgi:hypothetical protein